MVLTREYSAQTKQLLNQKGLKCVCELCDCGRYHRHEGCTKSHKIQQVFNHPGMGQVATDYQSAYKKYGDAHTRHLKKPLPKMRNPHPPPMDFRTEHGMEFIKRDMPVTKSCKLLELYERPEEKLDGLTVYKREYIDRGIPILPKMTRPKTVIAPNPTKFHDQTTHNSTFTPKKTIPHVTYGELPSFTGSILFPDPKSKVKTTNQEVYKGKFVKVADLCRPTQAQVVIGMEGEHLHGTTHRDAFKTPEKQARQEPHNRKPQLKTDTRAKFQSQTQFKSDFPGYGGKMPRPTKAIRPPPETVNLAMNNNRDFQTTNDQYYKVTWDPKTIGRTQLIKPDAGTFLPPDIKMEGVSQSMQDYTQKEPVKMPNIRPQTRTEPSKSKFRDETAYNSQFRDYGKVPFKRYGDLHESPYYLKPVTKFYQGGSVTMQDFQGAIGGKPSTPYRPIELIHNNEGEILDHTTYGSAYVQKPQEMCSYLKWVTQRDTKKAVQKMTLPRQAEPQKNVLNETQIAKSVMVCGK